MKLTEIEKTILLSFFILAKGSTSKYIHFESLLSRFPIRQRKIVKKYVEKLAEENFLIKHKKENSYRVSKNSLKIISSYLVGGPRVRI